MIKGSEMPRTTYMDGGITGSGTWKFLSFSFIYHDNHVLLYPASEMDFSIDAYTSGEVQCTGVDL